MFMFGDIIGLDDRSVQQVLRQVDAGDLALALKGVNDAVKTKITSNLSARAAENSSRRSSCSVRSASPRSRRPSRPSSAPSASSRSRARSWSGAEAR